MTREKNRPKQDSNDGEVPPLEWVVAGAGLLLVLGSLGFLIYLALQGPPTPPDITVHMETVIPVQAGYLVQYVARNDGGETAAALHLKGELHQDETVIEVTRATLDYLPSSSRRQGGMFFKHDPRLYRLHLQAEGFVNP